LPTSLGRTTVSEVIKTEERTLPLPESRQAGVSWVGRVAHPNVVLFDVRVGFRYRVKLGIFSGYSVDGD
jgi:hypothetical protein